MAETKAVFTEGPIGRAMAKSAAAMLVGTISLSLYNLVDTYFVGKLGTVPLAAMGFTFPIVMLVGCVFRGIVSGVSARTAQSLGGGDHREARATVTSAFYMAILVSLVLALAGVKFSRPIFGALGASGQTLEQTAGYMDIWFLGGVTGLLCFLGTELLIAVGDTAMASFCMVLGTMSNVLFDYLLIFGHLGLPALGIRGAALATVMSQALGAALPWYLVFRKYHLFSWTIPSLKETMRFWARILCYGIPLILGNIVMPVGQTVITRVAASFGDVAVAAMGAVSRLEVLAFMVPMSVGFSLTPFVAQNFGAGLYQRLRSCFKIANTFAFFYLLFLSVVISLVSGPLVGQFSDDPAVCQLMQQGLGIIVWGFGLIEIFRYSTFFMVGCGHPAWAAILNILRMAGLLIPLSLLAIPLGNVLWLFWSRLISDVLPGLVGLLISGHMVWHLSKAKKS